MKKTLVCVWLCAALLLGLAAPMTVAAEDTYVMNGVYLAVGTAEYDMDPAYAYTVFGFAPEQEGAYTISCEQANVGIASYNDMWVMIDPTVDTVNSNTVSWTCTSVGQGILIAIEGGQDRVTVSVSREGENDTPEEPEWIVYENVVQPEAFVFEGDAQALLAVNTVDDIVDTAVLGKDGYYHLNTANGPMLYANLDHAKMSLVGASEYGQLKDVQYDADGNVTGKTEFNTAFAAYIACMDGNTSLYPLTKDLMAMFVRVGASQKWYGEGGFVGGVADDAWMYACCYLAQPLVGDVTQDGAVNIEDASWVFQAVNGTRELTVEQQETADVNGDGRVNLADVAHVFYAANGSL